MGWHNGGFGGGWRRRFNPSSYGFPAPEGKAVRIWRAGGGEATGGLSSEPWWTGRLRRGRWYLCGGSKSGGGGGGAGLDRGLFRWWDATIVGCFFTGNTPTGGFGGYGTNYSTRPDGTGIIAGVFTRSGTVSVLNTVVNVVTPSTPLELGLTAGRSIVAPSECRPFSRWVFAIGNIAKRFSSDIPTSTFTGGTIVFSTDRIRPALKTDNLRRAFHDGDFSPLKAVAYNSSFAASAEMDPVQITILPRPP